MIKQKNKLPATKLLLRLLLQTGKTVIDFTEFSNNLQQYQRMLMGGSLKQVAEFKKFKQRAYLRKILHNLKRARYVEARRIGKKLLISLNDKSKIELFVNKLKGAKLYPNNFYTVVVFDIPETERTARHQFRQLLRLGNFKLLQQSVWISKLDNYDLIAQFTKQHKIKPWVNVFVVPISCIRHDEYQAINLS